MAFIILLLFVCFLCITAWCALCFYSKVRELEEELHVVTNSLRSLEINDEKVRPTYVFTH